MYNPHDSDFLVLLGLLMVPAVIVFIIMTVIRVRRNKFHRQRITKGQSRAPSPVFLPPEKVEHPKDKSTSSKSENS